MKGLGPIFILIEKTIFLNNLLYFHLNDFLPGRDSVLKINNISVLQVQTKHFRLSIFRLNLSQK